MKKSNFLFITVLVLVLSLMLTACGGKSEEANVQVADEAVSEEEADIQVADEAVPAEEEGTEQGDLTALASEIGTAAMGVTEAGETIYYAEAVDSSFAILVFYDLEQNQNVSFVGPVSADGNAITITDYNNGLSFTFTMEAAEDDAVVIDTGDSGLAVMQECDPMEVLDAMQAISDYSEALA
ncbi:MAG: hypothetical protein EOM66_05355 [Clostridia bacterium]|nr:hypothetical protein [Candidatus Pelethousia sp.]NCB30818.1 hypothetical protein [Clostridia bacterium]